MDGQVTMISSPTFFVTPAAMLNGRSGRIGYKVEKTGLGKTLGDGDKQPAHIPRSETVVAARDEIA